MNERVSTYGSYDPTGGAGSSEDELERLRLQVELTWEKEFTLLSGLGLKGGLDVAEFGCGPGYFGSRLLEALPECSLHGVELNPYFCDLAQRTWKPFLARASVTQASVFSLPDQLSDQFDFVLARYLFQHLREPVGAASSILETLRPGGTAAIIDIDEALWGCVVPQHYIFERLYCRAGAIQASQGGDRMIGRKLLRIMSQAGYVAASLHAFTVHSDEVGLPALDFHLNPKRLLPAVMKGVLTLVEYGQAQMAYQEFLSDPGAYAIVLGFVCIAKKPLRVE